MRKMIMGVLAVAVMVGGVGGQTYWKKTYGGAGYDEARAITPTPDGNFIVAGDTYTPGATGEDVYLLKIKPNGDTVWTKTYGGANEDWASAIAPTPDGNFLVVGNIDTLGIGSIAIYLLKIKPNGDTLWTRTFGEFYCGAYAITPTSDGNFIIVGIHGKDGSNLSDVYILKLKPNGDTVWTKTYGGYDYSVSNAITPTSDGNFLVAGYSASFDTKINDVYLLKLKPNGDTLWTKTYGGSDDDGTAAIMQTPEGNFIIAGWTTSFGNGKSATYLLKIKPNGDTLWTKTYGGANEDWPFAIAPTQDGNFIVVGSELSAEGEEVHLLKVRPNGDTLWTKTIAGSGDDRVYAISPTSDGNFIVAGYWGSGSGDEVYLISLIDDRYAYKYSLFTFKIPVSGDSLNHGYAPLKVPVGMTVSMGGTISWTPTTDSSFMDHVEFLVFDDMGKKDTLTFNIFVNSKAHPTKAITKVSRPTNTSQNDLTIHQLTSKEVLFSLPAGTKSLGIYNIHGQLLENISVTGNQASWLPKHAAGRYFAKAIWEKQETVKPFMLLR
jgi:outer membrane lipoprotein-sorting protein